MILEERTYALPPEHPLIWKEFEEHVVACLLALDDELKLAWLLKFDPERAEWIAVLAGKQSNEIRVLYRQSATREIFIDEAHAAALMQTSVWSYRRKYEKAQKMMNALMRKNGWGDILKHN